MLPGLLEALHAQLHVEVIAVDPVMRVRGLRRVGTAASNRSAPRRRCRSGSPWERRRDRPDPGTWWEDEPERKLTGIVLPSWGDDDPDDLDRAPRGDLDRADRGGFGGPSAVATAGRTAGSRPGWRRTGSSTRSTTR